MEAAFKARDPSNTGYITPEEFKDAFASLGGDKVDVSEITFFLIGKTNKVDYREWLCVKMVSKENNTPPCFSF